MHVFNCLINSILVDVVPLKICRPQKSLSSTGLNSNKQQATNKKNPAEKKGNKAKAGILVNKNEQQTLKAPPQQVVTESNNFAESQPKDDVAMLKVAQVR